MTPSPSLSDGLGLVERGVSCACGQLARHWRRDLHPALANRIENGADPIGGVQLAQHRGHVVLDRLLGDEELVGDLLVGESLRDAVEHRQLPRRERHRLFAAASLARQPQLGA